MTRQKRPRKESSNNIGKRHYPVISDTSLIKSIEFARRCTEMGLEAKVILCLALFKIRVPSIGFRMTIIGPHFYTEVLGKLHEAEIKNEEQNEPKVLVRLGKY